jgi:hypothetical protein
MLAMPNIDDMWTYWKMTKNYIKLALAICETRVMAATSG